MEVVDDDFVTQHVTFLTRGSETLDLVLSDEENRVFDSCSLGPFSTSDHESVSYTHLTLPTKRIV